MKCAKDLAYQVYQLNSGKVYAIYKLSKNSFSLLKDDAADIIEQFLGGEQMKFILQNFVAKFGEDCQEELVEFLNEWNEILYCEKSRSQERDKFNAPERMKGEGVEASFNELCTNNHILSSLTCELTYACSQKCLHCYNPHHTHDGELSTEEWCNVLDESTKLGVLNLCLTGGECALHPGFWQIIRGARENHMAVTVQSNGLSFDSKEKMQRLADFYPKSFEVSLYAASPEIHDKITGTIGSWKRTMRALEYATSFNIPLAIKFPVMTLNHMEAEPVSDIAKYFHANLQIDLCITAKNDGNQIPLTYRLEDPEILLELLLNPQLEFCFGTQKMAAIQLPPRNSTDFLCGAGQNSLSINPNGNVLPCAGLNLIVGNLRKEKISDIWHGNSLNKFRNLRIADRKKCASCVDNPFCTMCPGLSIQEKGNLLFPSNFDCNLAQIRKKAVSKAQSSSIREKDVNNAEIPQK